jgi:putative copper resistance protein D
MFWWLTYGLQGTAMPSFRDRLSEEERWDLINTVRILSASEQARPLGTIVSADLRVVAPDLSYATSLGETRALKDFRSHDQVLLVFFSLPHSRERLMQLQSLYPKVRPLDVEILAIPLRQDANGDDAPSHLSLAFPLISDGASEATTTYALFHRSLSSERLPPDAPPPSHVEFLVDRQGYLRGRWLPSEGVGWGDVEQLTTAIEILRQEKLDALLPDLHVH